MSSYCYLLLVVFLVPTVTSAKDITKENCEVCVTVLDKFVASVNDDVKTDQKKVHSSFMKFCTGLKKTENRFCYYVGGLEESATSVLGEITKRVTWGVPSEKICQQLNRKDSQICELKYEKQIDLSNVNFKKLKVRDLKKILSDWEEQCRGCTEKSDFVTRIKELMPTYAPDAAKILKDRDEL